MTAPNYDALVRGLLEDDWDFAEAATGHSTHALHPYPAKFIPQIPARFIGALSEPGDLVVDPFSGSGTAGVEAREAERDFHGIDANPVAVLVGRVKTRPLSAAQLQTAERFRLRAHRPSKDWADWVPDIPNIGKWFAPGVIKQLATLRREIAAVSDGCVRDLLSVAMSRVVGAVSFQESETRYVSQPRAIESAEVTQRMAASVRAASEVVRGLRPSSSTTRFVAGDARDPAPWGDVADGSASLVVTSPPYPNAYDYHLYHRFRIFWLGFDPKSLRDVEVGSHLTNQRSSDPIADYEQGLQAVLGQCARVLRCGGHAVFVVGDGVHVGEVYPTSEAVARIGAALGLETVATIERRLPTKKRSVTVAGRRLAAEQLVVLRRPPAASPQDREMVLLPPDYERHDYEVDLASREAVALLDPRSVSTRPDGALDVDEPGAPEMASRLTFAAFVRTSGADQPTLQRLAEGSGRKNSTYASHGIHKYRGKFYPQLARVLLNMSGVGPGMRVLDPFGGSGTTALEARLAGADALSVDWNPLAVLIARTKAESVELSPGAVADAVDAWAAAAAQATAVCWDQFPAAVHAELDSWFPAPVLARLSHALLEIRTHRDQRMRRVGEVLVSDIVRDVSHQEPRDLRIRRRKEPIEDADVGGLLAKRGHRLAAALGAFQVRLEAGPALGTVRVLDADVAAEVGGGALDGALQPESLDAVVTSPPYATALPYLDTDRLSLALVLGIASGERRRLEGALIGSREFRATDFREYDGRLDSGSHGEDLLPATTWDLVTSLRDAVVRDERAGFRRRQKPAALLRYFESMARSLRRVHGALRPGASAWYVVGDSSTKIGGETRRIPTTGELASIAKHAGYEVEEVIPITVTRDGLLHARNRIVENAIIHLRA